MRPLSTSVWLYMILVSISAIIILKLIFKIEKLRLNFIYENFESTWSAILLFVFGTLCQQGSVYTPNLTSGRIISITIILLAFLVYQFYTGYIVSYLLMASPNTINDLEDLLHSNLELGIEDTLIDRDYFVVCK